MKRASRRNHPSPRDDTYTPTHARAATGIARTCAILTLAHRESPTPRPVGPRTPHPGVLTSTPPASATRTLTRSRRRQMPPRRRREDRFAARDSRGRGRDIRVGRSGRRALALPAVPPPRVPSPTRTPTRPGRATAGPVTMLSPARWALTPTWAQRARGGFAFLSTMLLPHDDHGRRKCADIRVIR